MDLLQRMLVADPKHRISAAEAIRHPYFEQMGAEEAKVSSPCVTAVSKFRLKL
jgi:serine/threonine protein kinase